MKQFFGALLVLLLLTASYSCSAKADVIESVMILVNKDNALPSNYVPSDLTRPDVAYASGVVESRKQMRESAARALEELFSAALEDDIELLAVSGYRSYWTQNDLYNRRLKETSLDYVSLYVAQPGYSEHQTGLAMDVGCEGCTDLSDRFADTEAYDWLLEHAHEYGFIIRYPQNGTEETGYAFEPWHIRYLGDMAAEVHENAPTLEAWYENALSRSTLLRPFKFRLSDLRLP